MDQLAVLARKRLPLMLDERSGLFAEKAVWTPSGALRSPSTNALYSAMSVVGIQHDSSGRTGSIRVDRTLDVLHALVHRTSSSVGLLGATIWAFAAARDDRANSLVHLCEKRFKASRTASMDLGLVLSGLAVATQAFPGLRAVSTQVASSATRELLDRFSDSTQLFSASSGGLRTRRGLHRRVTSFASQVYPIHGLSQFSHAAGVTPPPQLKRAADRLVETQGSLGQWWWMYSSSTGSIVEAYPVYSVHQDAMAFMALAPLQNLGLGSYVDELARSLQWIFGRNELGKPLVSFERGFMARCIQRRGADANGLFGMSRSQRRRTLLAAWGLRSPANPAPGQDELEMLEECRPYELGWLLYARSLISDW